MFRLKVIRGWRVREGKGDARIAEHAAGHNEKMRPWSGRPRQRKGAGKEENGGASNIVPRFWKGKERKS